MRLINAKTQTLDEFFDSATPPYAILSHTWGDGEVRFQDMMAPSSNPQGLPGFSKIEETCRLALAHGLEWAWVDTCCIDKSSSAELTEAINSMFRWYQNADLCLVFLFDLDQLSDLPECRWFTRGWTLQEMLAPARIEFYNQTWTSIGTKELLLPQLSNITGIRQAVLTGAASLANLAVAEKMSWAAHRTTTRSEDAAYCLFGLFDVNMPLIYGEGHHAFRRLQEEIIRRSNDLTIFAWEHNTGSPWNHNLFATSPRDFAVYRDKFPDLTHMESRDLGVRGVRPEYTLTNSGLRLDARLEVQTHFNSESGEDNYLLKLVSVSTPSQPHNSTLAITLVKIGAGLFLRRGRLLEAITQENVGSVYHRTTTDPHVITISLSDNHSTTLARLRNLERSVKISLKGSDVNLVSYAMPENLWDWTTGSFFCPYSDFHVSAALLNIFSVNSFVHVPILVVIDRRGGSSPLLVDWVTDGDKWKAWLFQERHAREPPTWDDLRYQIGESVDSLSQFVTWKPSVGDPDRSPLMASATLIQRDISLEDFQDLPPGTQLPQGQVPRYELVIKITR